MPGPIVFPRKSAAVHGPVNLLYVGLATLVAATSGLLFGFDIAVINGALLFLRQQFGLTEVQTEFAASSLLAGCVAGAAIGGWISDRLGRRKVLIYSAVLFAFSSIGAALPRNLTEFTIARLAGGLAIGAGIAWLLKTMVSGLPVNTPWDYAIGALVVSVLIGLAAGVVPAMRAARLNPVDALRTE